jgi:hypothetical protein
VASSPDGRNQWLPVHQRAAHRASPPDHWQSTDCWPKNSLPLRTHPGPSTVQKRVKPQNRPRHESILSQGGTPSEYFPKIFTEISTSPPDLKSPGAPQCPCGMGGLDVLSHNAADRRRVWTRHRSGLLRTLTGENSAVAENRQPPFELSN